MGSCTNKLCSRFVAQNTGTHLCERELCAYVTDVGNTSVYPACMQELRCLKNGLNGLGNFHVCHHMVITHPLVQLIKVVTDMHTSQTVAQVLAQQQFIERIRTNKVEQLRNKSKPKMLKITH